MYVCLGFGVCGNDVFVVVYGYAVGNYVGDCSARNTGFARLCTDGVVANYECS